MKKILMAAAAALCFASGSFAQENAGGDDSSKFAFGKLDKPIIVAGAVGLGILGAVVANNRGSSTIALSCGVDETLIGGVCVPDDVPDPVCGAGEELIDGECVPTAPTTTGTGSNPITGTNTSPITTPVTVTATTTSL